MMKKILAVLLGACMLLGCAAFAACGGGGGGGGGGTGEEVDITYWNLLTGADGTVMRQMVEDFNEEYEGRIYVSEQSANEDVYYDNLNLNIPIGRGPDVAIMHSYRVQSYANQGLLYAADDLISQAGIDMADFPEQIVQSLQFNGSTYAIPLDMHPLGIYYNKTLLAQYGCEVPTTRSELIAAAQKADNAEGGVWGFPIASGWPSDYTYTTALYQFGGVEVKDGDQPGFNTEAGRSALQSLTDLLHTYHLSPTSLGNDQDLMYFRSGDALFHINGVWMLNSLKTSNVDFGVIPLSRMFNPESDTVAVRSHTFVFPRQNRQDDEKLAAAAEFVKWMTENSHVWATAGQVPASARARETQEYKDLEYVHDFGDVSTFRIGVSSPFYFEAYTPIYSRIVAAMQTPSYDAVLLLNQAEEEGIKLVREAKEMLGQ